MGACVRKVTLMNAWYLLYCNNNDLDRIAYRCKTMNVVAFCPRYIKFTPRKDCNAVRKEEKVLFPNYLFLHFDVNVTHTSAITSIPGAIGFVSFGSTICTVPEKVVIAIKCAKILALNLDDDSIECRNIGSDLLAEIQRISSIISPLERQTAFSRLLQNQ
ncbi:transcriptional antiterminator NusG [Shigella sonnei]|nr:transcriptional antiterminator NusG [Salmonella enterica]EJA8344163.1 transcriptional antiterminator NusG [Shigella sonnei]EKD5305626.1 transcriptional antiterminator NusG [Shigella flexneri]EJB4314506.1 transcriptional antiterminator NusG [Shigella sonnei]EJD8310198.1 transcriptional antiterminator NusG [Shigella sonnei]